MKNKPMPAASVVPTASRAVAAEQRPCHNGTPASAAKEEKRRRTMLKYTTQLNKMSSATTPANPHEPLKSRALSSPSLHPKKKKGGSPAKLRRTMTTAQRSRERCNNETNPAKPVTPDPPQTRELTSTASAQINMT